MNLSTQPYKGARDFYPEDKRIQKYMFDKLRLVVESFGYQEYDAPIIEPLDLYLSKSSDEIVAEQTYNFTDRGDRKVTLRPEMTPTISRMVAGRRQELAYPLRWYSIPDLWRYEVPHQEFLDTLSELVSPGQHHELVDVLSLESFDELPDKYKQHPAVGKLARLKQLLAKNGINNVVDDLSLMRGFDYYTNIVFEVFDTHPDNNRSMFGGGRYDGLVGLFGVEPLPTVGFGMGDVTLQNFLKSHGLVPEVNSETDAVVILVGDVYEATQSVLAQLRLSGLKIAIDASERKLDTKIKHADKAGAQHVIFIGEKELAENQFKLRDLQKGQEELLSLDQISDKLKSVKSN
jgi:histidyl-tRNA synthetase